MIYSGQKSGASGMTGGNGNDETGGGMKAVGVRW